MLEPYKVYWMEECLQPHDYEGFGRLNAAIKSTRIVTGEHEYYPLRFPPVAGNRGASIWQPDINWCGGLTEMRRIGALAPGSFDIPVIPMEVVLGRPRTFHGDDESPWAELFMPAPGGPKEVYDLWDGAIQPDKGAGRYRTCGHSKSRASVGTLLCPDGAHRLIRHGPTGVLFCFR